MYSQQQQQQAQQQQQQIQQQQQQQQNSLLQSSMRQASQADFYSAKANLPIDPTLFAQQALLQAGIEASSRQQQNNQQQQQIALAMANLLGQCTTNPLLALYQRRDLCKCAIFQVYLYLSNEPSMKEGGKKI